MKRQGLFEDAGSKKQRCKTGPNELGEKKIKPMPNAQEKHKGKGKDK